MPALNLNLEWQLDDYLRMARLHWRSVLGLSVACGLWFGFQMAQRPNIYQASARILIETSLPRVVNIAEVGPYINPWDTTFIQTETQIITSPRVMQKVVEELNLTALAPFSKAEDPGSLVRGMVEVRLVKGTRLFDIVATGTKPELTARIANGVAQTYVKFNLERRQEQTLGGVQWLSEEVSKMEEKMRASQLALQAFVEKNSQIDFGEERRQTLLQRLQELSTAVTDTRKLRIEAETKYREKHPVLLELQARERELERALGEQERLVLELNRLSIQYNEFVREVKTTEGIYNVLFNRLKELSVQEGVQSNNVQVVSLAKVPRAPMGPNRGRGTFQGILLGFLLGCAQAAAREALTKTIRSRREFEFVLEIPFLGHIPSILKKGSKGLVDVMAFKGKKSAPAEAIRSVRTTIEFLLPTDQPQVLLLTSALPEEGKSLITANLAISFQELGRKVILVDADLRRPSAHRYLEFPLEPGLSDYLEGRREAQEVIQVVSTHQNLPVIPAGITPTQPSDLLASPRMAELIEKLKQEYRFVLLDTPPVLAVADTTVMARLCDGVIYLVWGGRTHRDVAQAGKQRLIDVGAKLIGGILNSSQPGAERSYGYSYYYYGRREGKGPAKGDSAPLP